MDTLHLFQVLLAGVSALLVLCVVQHAGHTLDRFPSLRTY